MDLFKDIKAGDRFAVSNRNRSLNSSCPSVDYNIRKVDRVTATMFMAGTSRYQKKDGKEIGEDYKSAKPATPELLSKHEQQVLAQSEWFSAKCRLEKAKTASTWASITPAQMNALAAAYEALVVKESP